MGLNVVVPHKSKPLGSREREPNFRVWRDGGVVERRQFDVRLGSKNDLLAKAGGAGRWRFRQEDA